MDRTNHSGYRHVLVSVVAAAVLGGRAAPASAQAAAGTAGGGMPKADVARR